MTTSPAPTVSNASAWHLDSVEDFRYVDENLSGLRRTQGIVWNPDAGEWITAWQFGLARETEDFKFLQTTGTADLSKMEITTGIPKALADMGFDHVGDIDYYNGKLYISLDSEAGDYQNGHVAVLNASDLSYTGELYELVGAPSNPHDDVASWVAVDGANGLGYGKEWQNGTTINVYNLEDWSFKGTLEMDQSLKNIQGAKVFEGKLYFSAHDNTKGVYTVDLQTGHVENLFDIPQAPNSFNETEGIAVRALPNGGIEIFVEMIHAPRGDNYADDYTRMYHYVIGKETPGEVSLAHTWFVTAEDDNTNPDDMSLTLREAIAKANAGDTITFDASLKGKTITLGDVELALSKDITIEGDLDGDGKGDIKIAGGGTSPVFHVTGGKAILNGLVVTNSEAGDGSLIADDGATLVFTNGATTDLQTEGDDVLTGTKSIDVIHGGAGGDIILGLRGNDILFGDAGNDTLLGGAGDDTMVGGQGDDTYFVADSGDVVIELKNRGTDTVKASLSYTLGDNVENLTLTGTGDLNGTGNNLANMLTGNAGANTLAGLAGNDILRGGTGADSLWGGAGADRFVFAFGDTSASKTKADTIYDLQASKGDLIDLHLIDANEGKGGNQAFSFIGTDKFSGHAGELRYEKAASDTYIYGDTDGDGKADFAIHLDGAMTLKADYFLL
ncbi:calcium-binding protein [Rhizobium sp. KVB221]|uniref:Calcium-binding protein n=1 Tax=Rhizobium setariae TaxID=2801340 RepID=A0A937CPY5_9HYPH|nr:calcium-binding protein [Rhizobium setariae]MBL0375471.1 calcium-binding protein [Rhizobium setariae]